LSGSLKKCPIGRTITLVVNKATTGAIRTCASGGPRATNFRLVFRMALNGAQFLGTMCKLTFVTVATSASLRPRAAQFGFVKTLLLKFRFNIGRARSRRYTG